MKIVYKIQYIFVTGEVSDSEDDSGEEQFYDGFDENLMGDEEDKQRLEDMTEKEREQELFRRMERRSLLQTRFVLQHEIDNFSMCLGSLNVRFSPTKISNISQYRNKSVISTMLYFPQSWAFDYL